MPAPSLLDVTNYLAPAGFSNLISYPCFTSTLYAVMYIYYSLYTMISLHAIITLQKNFLCSTWSPLLYSYALTKSTMVADLRDFLSKKICAFCKNQNYF